MRAEVRRSVASVAAVGLTAFYAHLVQAGPPSGSEYLYDSYKARGRITLVGTIRDFVPSDSGGHADFTKMSSGGGGVGKYINVVSGLLGADGKPVYNSTGYKLKQNWRDASARNIIPSKSYIDAWAGDVTGLTWPTAGGTVTSAATFTQWFRDVSSVNSSSRYELTLVYDPARRVFAFDSSTDGFKGGGDDFSYTLETDAPFVYEKGGNWYIATKTNGDVFVYIDDHLVIDGAAGLGSRPALVVEEGLVVENSAIVGFNNDGTSAVSTNSVNPAVIQVLNSAQIDGDVMVGPGGEPGTGIVLARSDSITGSVGSLGQEMEIDVVTAPAGMPLSAGNRLIKNTAAVLIGDLHYQDLTIRTGASVTIVGATRILCDGNFSIEQSSEILLAPGATLELYVQGFVSIRNSTNINANSGNPDRVLIACLGAASIVVDNNVNVFAHLAAPKGLIDLGNSVNVSGTATSHSARIHNTGKLTAMGGWGAGSKMPVTSMAMTQRIDLDRLAWLTENRTHRLRVFFANRLGHRSNLRLETSMTLLKVAARLRPIQED